MTRVTDGEGYNVEVLINGQVVVYWFSYDPEGKRRWFFGLGEIREGKLVFDEMLTSSGGIFGPDFDPDDVDFKPWGSLELDLDLRRWHRDLQQHRRGFWFRHAECCASDQHRPATLPIAEHCCHRQGKTIYNCRHQSESKEINP